MGRTIGGYGLRAAAPMMRAHSARMAMDPSKTAVVLIEYQNEFCKEGGGLFDAVKGEMERTSMLKNTAKLVGDARAKGIKIVHAPITFNDEHSDVPQSTFGILKGVKDGALFKASAWGGQIIDELAPEEGDLVVDGKKGLDAFPGTNLEELLRSNGIENVALGGFLTNCCVESTMRTAYEKGFNVVTLKDCTAATSEAEFTASTEGTWNMFSTPMESSSFIESVEG